jgi:hypothetical protein
VPVIRASKGVRKTSKAQRRQGIIEGAMASNILAGSQRARSFICTPGKAIIVSLDHHSHFSPQ